MNSHKNARLTLTGRLQLMRALAAGVLLRVVAAGALISVRRLRILQARFAVEGESGLQAGSSRLHHSARQLPRAVRRQIVQLRQQRQRPGNAMLHQNRRWVPQHACH